VEYSGSGCLVDIGAKVSAFLPEQEAALVIPDGTKDLSSIVPLDQPIEFQIISDEDENGLLLVSIKHIQYKKAWEVVQQLAGDDSVIAKAIKAIASLQARLG